MTDIVGKIFSYVFGILLSFFLPMLLITLLADFTIQVSVNDAVNEFTAKAKTTGVISSTGYEQMINRLDRTGVVYDITISHLHTTAEPMVAEDGSIIRGKMIYAEHGTFTPEILSILFPDTPSTEITYYHMNKGDLLQVNVANRTQSLGGRYLSMLNPLFSGNNISVSSSECIGNELEDI